jgi:hypothetical protein
MEVRDILSGRRFPIGALVRAEINSFALQYRSKQCHFSSIPIKTVFETQPAKVGAAVLLDRFRHQFVLRSKRRANSSNE